MSTESWWRKPCPKCKQVIRWKGEMLKPPPCPRCNAKDAAAESMEAISQEVATALDVCGTIFGLCEEMPSAGQDFADSVLERVRCIERTIVERSRVSNDQMVALENMKAGLEKWFH